MKSIKVPGTENILGNTYYEIEVNDGANTWTVTSRYSELLNVHAQFASMNKSKTLPEFPGKKTFGAGEPTFINKRRKGFEIYFTNLLNLEVKLKYNTSAWWKYFRDNISVPRQSPNNSTINIERKENKVKASLDLGKEELSEKETDEKIYDEFCKKLIIVENKLFSFEDQQRNSFPVTEEITQMGYAVADANKEIGFQNKNQNFLIEFMDFCNHVDEIVINQGLQAKKIYKREIIGNLKLDY